MRFAIGFAGIPHGIFDEVYARRQWICGDNVDFISIPIKAAEFGKTYPNDHKSFFLKKFYDLLVTDHHNDLRDTGFALVHVHPPGMSSESFADCFFPSIFCTPIFWEFDQTTRALGRQSKNRLLNQLQVATNRAKKAIPALKKELTERDSRTPLLLPVRNFHSKCLVPELWQLQEDLISANDKSIAIENRVQEIQKKHPLSRDVDSSRSSFFEDDRRIRFNPPGRERHAFARPKDGHLEQCLIAGRRRLGAPYDHAFHYDCTKDAVILRDHFFGCHEKSTEWVGKPHLNIAPNDFVRA